MRRKAIEIGFLSVIIIIILFSMGRNVNPPRALADSKDKVKLIIAGDNNFRPMNM